MAVETKPKFKVGDWVWIYLQGVPKPFKCQVKRLSSEEYGIFTRKTRLVYILQIPEQEWVVHRYEHEIARTQSGLSDLYC